MNAVKRYTIAFLEWDVYTLDVTATSEAAALAKARQNHARHGLDDWRHSNDGDDGFTIIDQRELRR